jgi:hypothetical protein
LTVAKPKVVESEATAIARIKHHTYCQFIDRGFLAFRAAVAAGVTGFGLWEGHETVKEIAHGAVDWNMILRAMASGKLPNGIMLLVALLALAVAGFQTHLRHKHSKEKDAYIKELEQKIDSHRSSSRLLASGKTRKEDKE